MQPAEKFAHAFGAPGIPPKWTSSSKEGVGTAYSSSSCVWFTLSHGILNEIYYPTIDRPQIRDMQFLITDGETFFHEEKRDLAHEISYMEQDVLGYRVVRSDPDGRYRLTKVIISDPHQPCVLIQVHIEPAAAWTGRLQLYALLAPHMEGGGWGNSARRYSIAGNKLLIAWKDRTCLAMGASTGLIKSSCGFVGFSDGWQDLRHNLQLDWEFEKAENGNIAVIGQVDLTKSNRFELGLAFGDGLHATVSALLQSFSVPFATHQKQFIQQWKRVRHDVPDLANCSHDEGCLFRTSRSLLLAHEDKTFAGALIASASIPWGDAKGDVDLGGYHLVWTRDMVNSATGLLAGNDIETPRRALVYLACSQQRDGGFPQNFWLDGTPYWSGIQLDEVAFPIILAWRLWKADALGEFDPFPMVQAAAAYLIRQGPMTQQERWEENSGYSPSTLAVNVAALLCAADFARVRGQEGIAIFLEEYADFLESHIERWTVTTQGTLVKGIPKHYIRIHPVDISNPAPDEDPNQGTLGIRNQPHGDPWEFPANTIVDAGFLELVRYGIRKPGSALMEDSLRVVDAVLRVDTPYGPCWHRYNHDGYGQRHDGGPFEGWGKGRAWPLLTGERGHYELATGRDVMPFIQAMEKFASGTCMLPEQVWDEADQPDIQMFLGRHTGSAMPLMWAHAEYIKLVRSASDGQVFDRISVVADRYLSGNGRKDLEVWKPNRQVHQVSRGEVLRVQAPESFRLHWTIDEWQTTDERPSTSSGLGIDYVDIPVSMQQQLPISFTLFWPEREVWEGVDYEVKVR